MADSDCPCPATFPAAVTAREHKEKYLQSWSDFVVDWGDGFACHIAAHDQPEVEHEFSAEGRYTVHITGTITGLCFGMLDLGNNLLSQLLNISQWGCLRLRSGYRAFKGCEKLVVSA